MDSYLIFSSVLYDGMCSMIIVVRSAVVVRIFQTDWEAPCWIN